MLRSLLPIAAAVTLAGCSRPQPIAEATPVASEDAAVAPAESTNCIAFHYRNDPEAITPRDGYRNVSFINMTAEDFGGQSPQKPGILTICRDDADERVVSARFEEMQTIPGMEPAVYADPQPMDPAKVPNISRRFLEETNNKGPQ